jgi:hypothetical protein
MSIDWASGDYALRVSVVEQLHEQGHDREARALSRLPEIVDPDTALLADLATEGMLSRIKERSNATR